MHNFLSLRVLWLRMLAARLCVERGQTMAEYGILIAVIAIVVVAVAVLLGGSISSIFRDTSTHL